FGVMKIGDTGKHTFVIRNEGEAPLKLGTPRTTCQCTVSEAAKNAIPPGGEGTVTLEYTPTAATPVFDKGAVIATNDPKMPEIRIGVTGRVDPLVIVEPQGPWYAGEVSGDTPIKVSGYVFSRILDDLAVESVESENPLLTASAEPMDAEKLREYEAKSGYRIDATLSPGIPVGKFNESLAVATNADDEEFRRIDMKVTGTRHGPIQVLPTPGVKWRSADWALDLGRFPAAEGASATVSMFVSDLPDGEELRFETVDAAEPYVEVDLARDESFDVNNRQRYDLTFRVKPGAPPATHRSRGAVKVNVTTNHPGAKSMKFYVEFISSR
ncbi:MAG TPA: DUF1573 domain-containing protein, partial [Planctomycetaceae bacterium]